MTQCPKPENDNRPVRKPAGPRAPYPVEHPGSGDQPGSEPDLVPSQPTPPLPRL